MAGEEETRNRRASHRVVLVATALAFAIAATGIVVGGLDPEGLGRSVDRLAPDGAAEQFTAERIARLQTRVQLFGGAFLFIAVAGFTARRRIEAFLDEMFDSLGNEWRDGGAALRGFFQRDRAHAVLLALFCALYAFFAWSWIDQSARTDEAQTFMTYVTKPWYYIVGRYTTNNHILYSLMASGSCASGLPDLICLRLPAFFAGIALIPASYVCMRVHLGRSVGLLTAATVACSPYAIDFGTNGRGYTTVALAFLCLLALARGLSRAGPARWLSFILVSVIGFWTVPVMAYPFAIVLVWLALEAWRTQTGEARREFARRFVAAGVAIVSLVALLYAPTFVVTGFGEVVSNSTVSENRPSDPTSLLSQVGDILAYVWKDWAFGFAPLLPTLLSLGFLVGCFAPVAESAAHRRLLFALAAGLAFVLAITRAVPPSWIFLFLLPVAIGLGFSGWMLWLEAAIHIRAPGVPRSLVVALGALIVAVNTWSFVSSDALDKPRWYIGYLEAPQMAARLIEALEPGDAFRGHTVVVPPLLFHLRALGLDDPEAFAWRDPDPGRDLYFVATRHRESGEILADLQADGVVAVEELERFDRSTLLRIRALSPPDERGRAWVVPRGGRATRAAGPPVSPVPEN